MTAKDFLNELGRARDAFRWGRLAEGPIRGVLESGKIRTAWDPVTAVLYGRIGAGAAGAEPERAAAELGLSPLDAASLRDAVEGEIWKQVDGQTVLDGYSDWLREEMLDRLGLASDERGFEPGRTPETAPVGIPLEPEPQLQHF